MSSVPGTQIKMVGIGENDFGAEIFQRFLRQGLDGGGGAHGHENGRFDGAVRRGEYARTRARWIRVLNFEGKTHFAVYQEKTKANPTRRTHRPEKR